MNVPPASRQKSKIGTCPHGLPQGACPICNGMGGGSATRKTDPHAGEMSWDECFAIGQMLKAQKLAQQQRDIAMQARLHAPPNTQSKLENISQKLAVYAEKLADFVQRAGAQSISGIFSKPLVLAAKLAIPVLSILKNVPTAIQKTINFIKGKLADITDKLNALFGEAKAAEDKKISDRLKDFKKKFKSLFEIFNLQDIENEEKKVEESKRMFKLRTLLNSINEVFKKKDKINADG